jgi:hypothetical protein
MEALSATLLTVEENAREGFDGRALTLKEVTRLELVMTQGHVTNA